MAKPNNKKMTAKELEARLGQQYAQVLKETRHSSSVHQDCQEVIQASLGVLEYYNRISMAMRSKKTSDAFS